MLATMVEIVVFLFAAFGNHLTTIAPPLSRIGGLAPSFAAGVASFAALLVFLLAKFWINEMGGRAARLSWGTTTVVLTTGYIMAALSYGGFLSHHTFRYSADDPEARVEIAGTELTESGREYTRKFHEKERRDPLDVELLRYVGNDPARIPTLWTPSSILSVQQGLITRYVAMVVLLASAIAGLIELLLSRSVAPDGPAQPRMASDGSGNELPPKRDTNVTAPFLADVGPASAGMTPPPKGDGTSSAPELEPVGYRYQP